MLFKESVKQAAVCKPHKRQVACRFATDSVPPNPTANPALHIARHLEEEVVVEGLLHVTAVQAGSCLERYGDLENMTRAAPNPVSLASALTRNNSNSSQLVSEAVCLATPPDNPTEDERRVSSIVRQAMRSIGNDNNRRVAAHEVEELVNLEAQACQRTAIYNMYTQELLQASTHISRKRRRALIRALRASRDSTKALLQAPAALLASLGSWDGLDDDRNDAA